MRNTLDRSYRDRLLKIPSGLAFAPVFVCIDFCKISYFYKAKPSSIGQIINFSVLFFIQELYGGVHI